MRAEPWHLNPWELKGSARGEGGETKSQNRVHENPDICGPHGEEEWQAAGTEGEGGTERYLGKQGVFPEGGCPALGKAEFIETCPWHWTTWKELVTFQRSFCRGRGGGNSPWRASAMQRGEKMEAERQEENQLATHNF